MSDELFNDNPLDPIPKKSLRSRIVDFFTSTKDTSNDVLRVVNGCVEVNIKKVAESKAGQRTLEGIEQIRKSIQERNKQKNKPVDPYEAKELMRRYMENRKANQVGLDGSTYEKIREYQRRQIRKSFRP